MGMEFAMQAVNGEYETRGRVPDVAIPSQFTIYNTGIYAQYTSLSRVKNLRRASDDQVALSLEIKKVELSVLHGILSNYKVANAVDQEIRVYRNRLSQVPAPLTYVEDKSYVSMLTNMAAQAALIHYLAYTLEYGEGVVLPSLKEKRKYKCDLFLSEIMGEERPIIIRSWPGEDIAFYVDPGQEIPKFLSAKWFAMPCTRFPLKDKVNFDTCRKETHKEPVLVLVPYKKIDTFMNRNWDVLR